VKFFEFHPLAPRLTRVANKPMSLSQKSCGKRRDFPIVFPWTTEERMQEMMALYALGALAEDEAWALENHLAENRNGLAEDLKAFETVAAHLAFAAPEQTPPLELRQNLLALVAQEAAPSAKEIFSLPITSAPQCSQFFSLHANEGEWQEFGPGMSAKTLFADQSRGIVTSLVRMMPGTALPPHKHLGEEQLYILEGDCYIHDIKLGPGDFYHASAGSIHKSTYTVGGTTFLLIAPVNYAILQPVH
jgi:anti-sigma factor ChrR (cupin superfamily)